MQWVLGSKGQRRLGRGPRLQAPPTATATDSPSRRSCSAWQTVHRLAPALVLLAPAHQAGLGEEHHKQLVIREGAVGRRAARSAKRRRWKGVLRCAAVVIPCSLLKQPCAHLTTK